jgi:hypothetical protein
MSYTSYAESFRFRIEGAATADQLIDQRIQELAGSSGLLKALDWEASCFDGEEDLISELRSELQGYIKDGKDGEFLILCDTGDTNCYADVFNALVEYFAKRQSGQYGIHHWSCLDSGEGGSSGTNRVYKSGESIAVAGEPDPGEGLLNSIADALWGDDADESWSADTLDAIADAIRTVRPDLVKARGGDV